MKIHPLNPALLSSLLLALILPACGPSKKQLLNQLNQIDQELQTLAQAEQYYASQNVSANVQAFVGGLAIGYGTVNGDGDMAGNGAGSAYRAAGQAGTAGQALQQIQARKSELLRQRAILSTRL
jgi:hypothetical protein